MHEAFAFPVSPEATSDQNVTRPLMGVLLATAPRTSVEHSSQTKSRLTGQGTVRLPASGLSDSVMPNVVETFDKAFDVAEASAVSHFFEFRDFGITGASSPISREEERKY